MVQKPNKRNAAARLNSMKDENDLQKKPREATECFKAAISEID
jgi:hypothetical protein